MIPLLCLLLAAPFNAFVEGRVGEPGGAPAPLAIVRLAQGNRTQVLRTGPDGRFRFRAFDGPGALSVTLPQGWATSGPLSRTIGPLLRGEVIRADFAAAAERVFRGRLLVGGAPLAHAEVSAGAAAGRTDKGGLFVFEHLPPGPLQLRVVAPPLAARVEVPAGPVNLSQDVSVDVPDLASLRLTPVPQGEAERSIADWISGKPLSKADVTRLERVAALSALDPAFRLAMVVRRDDAARGSEAAARLQRYLTGPALVPAERVVFAVGEFARPGHLRLLLTRLEETR